MDKDKLISKALEIMSNDIDKISVLSKNTETLDRQESQKINDYLRVLIVLNKEDRESSKLGNLSTKDDSEIEKMAKEALKSLGYIEDGEEQHDEEEKDEIDDNKELSDDKGTQRK